MVKWTKCTYADDFSGAGTLGLALMRCAKSLPLSKRPVLDHVFSCDKLRASKKLIHHVDPPRLWLDDVQSPQRADVMGLSKAAPLNIYQWTAPCQGWSSCGNQGGAEDPRSRLALVGCAAVQVLQPDAFISENVAALVVNKKFKPFFNLLLTKLTNAGYKVVVKVCSSEPYVPQTRKRAYIVGVKHTKLRVRAQGVPFFPDPPVGICPTLRSLINPLPSTQWLPHPSARKDELKYKNVIQAYKDVKDSVNPFRVPIIVDCGSSPVFSSFRVNEAPTLTRTRSGQKDGYWCSTKGGGLDATELGKLQGFEPEEFPWKEVGLSRAAAGGVMGNAQTLPLVADIVCHLLFHSCQIDFETFELMKRQFQRRG